MFRFEGLTGWKTLFLHAEIKLIFDTKLLCPYIKLLVKSSKLKYIHDFTAYMNDGEISIHTFKLLVC